MQVREFDGIMVDDGDVADARSGEIEQCRTAQPAGPNDQHGRSAELGLT